MYMINHRVTFYLKLETEEIARRSLGEFGVTSELAEALESIYPATSAQRVGYGMIHVNTHAHDEESIRAWFNVVRHA